MGRALVSLLTTVALASPAWADFVMLPDNRREDADHGTAELVEAMRRGDAAAVRAQLTMPITNGGVWFSDPACAHRFRAPGRITPDQATAFARCLARLAPVLSTRTAERSDSAVLTYAPGVELELRFVGRRVRAIGPWRRRAEPVPMLTVQAFEALRTGGSSLLDDATGRALLEPGAQRSAVSAWLEVCLDARGLVTTVSHHAATRPEVGEAIASAARAWTFRPFVHRGKATPACALTQIVYPATRAPATETVPPPPVVADPEQLVDLDDGDDAEAEIGPTGPPRPPPTIHRSALEKLRIAGSADILPSPSIRRRMVTAKKLSVLARARLCVDTGGHVTSTKLTLASGFADYDRQLVGELRRWRFKPYRIGTTPTAVCTVVSFVVTPDPTMNRP